MEEVEEVHAVAGFLGCGQGVVLNQSQMGSLAPGLEIRPIPWGTSYLGQALDYNLSSVAHDRRNQPLHSHKSSFSMSPTSQESSSSVL